jgi:hypothetical protein
MAITWAIVDNTDRLGNSASTSSIASVPFGTSAVGRHIVVFASTLNGSGKIASATIAGIAATSIGLNDDAIPTIAVAYVPGGTNSGTVTGVLDAADQLFIYTVIAVFGADSAQTAYDTAAVHGSAAGLIDIPAGGIILCNALAWQTGASTWTNATEAVAWRSSTACSVATYEGAAQTNRSISYGGANGTSFLSLAPATSSTTDAAGSASGSSAITGRGAAIAAAQGTAPGSSAVSGVGRATAAAQAAVSGLSAISGKGASISAATGTATGASTIAGSAAATAGTGGAAAGASSVSGVTSAGSVTAATGSATGTSAASGAFRATANAMGSGAGLGLAAGRGASVSSAQGIATGSSIVVGVGAGASPPIPIIAIGGQVDGDTVIAGLVQAGSMIAGRAEFATLIQAKQ